MLKKFCIIGLSVFVLTVSASARPRLFIGNAANGAPVNVLQHEALKLAFSGRYDVAQKHLQPSAAVEALRKKEVDVLILDTRFLPEKCDDLQIHPYAAEALCVYIHPGNPLGALTRTEVIEILTAVQPRWRDYNGTPENIQRIMLKSGSGGAALVNRVLGNVDIAAEIFRVSNTAQVFAFLNPAAAGFAPFQSERSAEVIAVPVNDIAPTTVTVSAGTYPLAVRYALVCLQPVSPAVQEFLNAVLSPESLDKLAGSGLIPVRGGAK